MILHTLVFSFGDGRTPEERDEAWSGSTATRWTFRRLDPH
jgi:hypothetical protein